MGVSDRYVGFALRLKREAPALFDAVHNGKQSLRDAIRELTGENDSEYRRITKSIRSVVNANLRDLEAHPDLMQDYLAVQKQFRQRLEEQ